MRLRRLVPLRNPNSGATQPLQNPAGVTETQRRLLMFLSCLSRLLYHLVFSTKDREPWLQAELRPGLWEYRSDSTTPAGFG